jgi:hypothetical protein
VPPNLDLPRSSRTEESNFRLEKMLELLTGVACILDPDGSIRATSENWDELLGRTGRAELLRNAVLGNGFLDLLPADDEVQAAFCFALATLAEGKQRQVVQPVDYSAPSRPLAVNYVIHALRDDDKLTGYMVQGLDVTHEAVIRVALLDRERRLREIKASSEQKADEIVRLKKQLDSRIAEHDKAVTETLMVFQRSPEDFGDGFCELAARTSGAMFAAMFVFSPAENRFRISAQHNAPEYHRFAIESDVLDMAQGEGPAGISAQCGCATKFDHLLEREDFAKWAPLAEQNGYNCIWALPLADESGTYGVLQLYYAEQDRLLTVDQYGNLASYCQTAAPLLRAADAWRTKPEIRQMMPGDAPKPEGFRTLAAGLSEEFSNLLTGVLGHSSLAASEIGESHTALNDIHAIEQAARNAARLTRRLSAISGASHKAAMPLDLAAHVRHYVQKDRAAFFPDGPAEVAVPESACPVHTDTASLEVMLDGMAEHARTAMTTGAPLWTLACDESMLTLTLSYGGPSSPPAGWDSGGIQTHSHMQIPELFFAREAARITGGEIALDENGGRASVTLTLPMASENAESLKR